MSDPSPKRNSSLSMTAVMPRPPLSTPLLAAMDLDPSNPETREMMAQATIDERRTAETLQLCEGPCRSCPCCHGDRMITARRAAEYRALTERTHALDLPFDSSDRIAPPDDAA